MDKAIFESVKLNIEEVNAEMESAAISAGRKPGDINLMAVTKTKPLEFAEAAYMAGVRLFGENRVTELEEKFTSFHKDAKVHLIGHLQRNKAKKAFPIADSIDSIDKAETALELDRLCKTKGKILDILLEYNTSGEDSKSGFSSEKDLLESADQIRALGSIRIKGLMTIAPFTDDEKSIRNSFRMLRNLYEKLKNIHPDLELDTLSMGMSSDFRIAIQEGSTIIRIGTRLFGSRV